MRTIRAIAAIAVSVTLLTGTLNAAGERSNIRGMGMARTFTAMSRGLGAVGVNPANLALQDGSMLSFSLPTLGIHVGSDVFDYDLYTRYFTGEMTDSGRTGRLLTETDKQDILSRFGNSVGSTNVDVDVRLMGVSLRLESLGAFAFTVTEHIGAAANLPQDYLKFVLYGNPAGSVYDFSATDVKASWTREYALSFGAAVPNVPGVQWLSAGATVKMVHGFAYAELERFNTSFVTADNGVLTGQVGLLARTSSIDMFDNAKNVGFAPFPQPAGSGIGVDLGVSGGINQFLSFGLSLTDIGTIRWSRNTHEIYADTSVTMDDPLDATQREGLEALVAGGTRETGAFSSPLPTMLRIGVAVEVHKVPALSDIPGELLVGFDYNQGLREAPASFIRPRFSFGLEYKPLTWLPIRSGISFGGTDHVNYALGIGFNVGFFELDLASENIAWLFSPASSSYSSFAFGMTLKF